jgi:Protein of unknown function (DUF4058)
MPSPFPAMGPYLEHPRFFPDLHGRLIFAIKEVLQRVLPRSYYAHGGERAWLETSQRYVEPVVNVTRERRKSETPRPTSNRGAVAVAEPEVETELEASKQVMQSAIVS